MIAQDGGEGVSSMSMSMREKPSSAAWQTVKVTGEARYETEEEVAAEYPLTIRLDGEEFATLVCSPSALEELVIGFLASEGVIRRHEEIKDLSLDLDGGFAHVALHRPQSTGKDFYAKRFIGSCCGKSRQFYFHNDARTAKTVTGGPALTSGQCFGYMQALQAQSADFRLTGGVHNAALFHAETGLVAARTDIGRHNALDKLFGHALKHRIPAKRHAIAFSGRLSSEIVLKAAKIGCPILLSKSAPTDLALRLAEDLGLTCVGFIREGSMNIYTHAHRVVL